MQICRVEHKETKFGPYNHLWSHGGRMDEISRVHNLPNSHCEYRCPAPYKDRALAARYWRDENKNKWNFGFTTIDQLFEWFSGDWPKILHEEGFHLVILDIAYPELTTLTGSCQVMYQPNHATCVGTMALV